MASFFKGIRGLFSRALSSLRAVPIDRREASVHLGSFRTDLVHAASFEVNMAAVQANMIDLVHAGEFRQDMAHAASFRTDLVHDSAISRRE